MAVGKGSMARASRAARKTADVGKEEINLEMTNSEEANLETTAEIITEEVISKEEQPDKAEKTEAASIGDKPETLEKETKNQKKTTEKKSKEKSEEKKEELPNMGQNISLGEEMPVYYL